jgi:hypothetical protein
LCEQFAHLVERPGVYHVVRAKPAAPRLVDAKRPAQAARAAGVKVAISTIELQMAPEPASASRDWHNEYAQTLLDLRAALRQASDDRTRQRLLREVRRQIQAHRLAVRTPAAV